MGGSDGTGSAAGFRFPGGMAIDHAGNLYVADELNNTLRKLVRDGTNWVVTTLAGLAGNAGNADGSGTAARFNDPAGVAVDLAGNLYVADQGNHTIRKVAPQGTNWVVATLAGLAGHWGSVDGTGSEARFNYPSGLAVDGSGNVYVADFGNCALRRITPAGAVATVAGLAGTSGAADGTAGAARFSLPLGVALDSAGNAYVSDSGNHTIRKVSPDGVVSTLAGVHGTAGYADGTAF
jgi:sugar lactone lactonase YvrE